MMLRYCRYTKKEPRGGVWAEYGGVWPPFGVFVAGKTSFFVIFFLKTRTLFVPMKESDNKENLPYPYLIERLEPRILMNGDPGLMSPEGEIVLPDAVIEAPAVIGEIEQPVNVTPNDADFLTRASIKQLANTEFVRNPETGLYVAEDSGEIVKSVNKDLIINPQKNFEIQQSAPLSAADIQALLSIDPDNLGDQSDTKV